MAVDVCSSSEPFISPRISFSHDLNNQSPETTTISSTIAAITTTFDFCTTSNRKLPPITSADELFLDGVLLPTKPKAIVSENAVIDVKQPYATKSYLSVESEMDEKKTNLTFIIEDKETAPDRKRLKELLTENDDKQERSSSRSFWKFTRTTSLNSSNDIRPKRLLRSLSLKRLLQSNLTLNHPRGNEDANVIKKSNSRKESSMSSSCFSSVHTLPATSSCFSSIHILPTTSGCNGDDSRRRLLTKKDSGGGIQINPTLNISTGYNMNLFGYGSLFCKGKPKNKTK